MFDVISDFIHPDAETQQLIEKELSTRINNNLSINLVFFKSNFPSIYNSIINHKVCKYSIFCTSSSQLNIVEALSGRVVYPSRFSEAVGDEVNSFIQAAPQVSITDNRESFSLNLLPQKTVVLMFGLGMGLQVSKLIEEAKPSILVIYEPEKDFFSCSLQAVNWLEIFNLAARNNTQISLQIANSGTSIANDLQELISLMPDLASIHVYRHLSHPISDEVINFLLKNSGDCNNLLKPHQFIGFQDDNLYNIEHPLSVLANVNVAPTRENDRFTENMDALKRFYPSLYKTFVNYKPLSWFAAETSSGMNLYCKDRSGFFYRDLEVESRKIVESFRNKPQDNEIILNQGGIGKFKNYIHFDAVKKLQPLLTTLKPRTFNQETEVENLIILGIGLGKHIEILLTENKIKNVFIFEPNVDFFYASLFVSDWSTLLKDAEESGHRIYFNIGGNGDEYFNDIMHQYYQIGAYGVAKTQIFNAFTTPSMKKALAKLKSQLKIIVAMGENFDHVRYGISHNLHSIHAGHGFLKANIEIENIDKLRDIPVFIVGNGPSLDSSSQYIIENRANVIVISCGTALRALYNLGITPDFHAEIEQNRATYCWISQVKDYAWLKKIKLLSVNGIHPQTAELFKDVYLAFKDGEASTNFYRNYYKKQGLDFISLSYAYPTVSNLVVSFFARLRFKDIYLFGVDLGYKSIENHHSKHSAYYKSDGSGVMNASASFDTGMIISGNFCRYVFTKPEFDFSRSIMELVFSKLPKGVNVYNCSDGAYINGATPLTPENILISMETTPSFDELNEVFDNLFYREEIKIYSSYFKEQIENVNLGMIVDDLISKIYEAKNYNDTKKIVSNQWDTFMNYYFKDSKLDFYLLCGSLIYMLSVLKRLSPISDDNQALLSGDLDNFNNALSIWKEYLNNTKLVYASEPFAWCDVDVTRMFN